MSWLISCHEVTFGEKGRGKWVTKTDSSFYFALSKGCFTTAFLKLSPMPVFNNFSSIILIPPLIFSPRKLHACQINLFFINEYILVVFFFREVENNF